MAAVLGSASTRKATRGKPARRSRGIRHRAQGQRGGGIIDDLKSLAGLPWRIGMGAMSAVGSGLAYGAGGVAAAAGAAGAATMAYHWGKRNQYGLMNPAEWKFRLAFYSRVPTDPSRRREVLLVLRELVTAIRQEATGTSPPSHELVQRLAEQPYLPPSCEILKDALKNGGTATQDMYDRALLELDPMTYRDLLTAFQDLKLTYLNTRPDYRLNADRMNKPLLFRLPPPDIDALPSTGAVLRKIADLMYPGTALLTSAITEVENKLKAPATVPGVATFMLQPMPGTPTWEYPKLRTELEVLLLTVREKLGREMSENRGITEPLVTVAALSSLYAQPLPADVDQVAPLLPKALQAMADHLGNNRWKDASNRRQLYDVLRLALEQLLQQGGNSAGKVMALAFGGMIGIGGLIALLTTVFKPS